MLFRSASDLERINTSLERRGIRFAVQTYPPIRHSMHNEAANTPLRAFARSHPEVALLDTHEHLVARFERAPNLGEEFYSEDPRDFHLGALGYGLVARQVYDELLAKGWLGQK